MNMFISFNCEVPEEQTSMQYFQIQLFQVTDQRSKSCRSWRKKSQHTLKSSSSSTDLQFRCTSTLTEEDRHTNSLLHCSDDILSIKLLLKTTKFWPMVDTWVTAPKKHLCGTKPQDWRQGYNCCHRNELGTLTQQRTAWFHPQNTQGMGHSSGRGQGQRYSHPCQGIILTPHPSYSKKKLQERSKELHTYLYFNTDFAVSAKLQMRQVGFKIRHFLSHMSLNTLHVPVLIPYHNTCIQWDK